MTRSFYAIGKLYFEICNAGFFIFCFVSSPIRRCSFKFQLQYAKVGFVVEMGINEVYTECKLFFSKPFYSHSPVPFSLRLCSNRSID